MKNNVVGWILTFVFGLGVQLAVCCYRRQHAWATGLTPNFIQHFGIYAALTTLAGVAMMALLLYVVHKESGITPRLPNPLAWWLVMIVTLYASSPQGPELGHWQRDELLLSFDLMMVAVAGYGLTIAFREGMFGGDIVPQKKMAR